MNKEEMMSKFKVGDKITRSIWEPNEYVEILCFGEGRFFVRDERGEETMWFYSDTFELWEEKVVEEEVCLPEELNEEKIISDGKIGGTSHTTTDIYASAINQIIRYMKAKGL